MASSHAFSRFRNRVLRSPTFLRSFSYKYLTYLSWLPAVIFFNTHVGEVGLINGASMYPYLNTDFNETLSRNLCWVYKWNPTKDLGRGMIVMFWSPYHPETLSIKRIIGLPGDTVYTRAPYPYPTAVVPRNHVWVEGDNKDGNKTLDSNYYGPIAIPLIQGKVTHILWPRRSFGSIPWWQFKGRTKVIHGREEFAPHFD
ncbi:mitochondrial inner membrane protease subunit 2 [Bisporella sp. PMI_857]|nr:mitochondrial inner membrane protease subunit 2 [Bisporella sp. PMI_857]